MVRIDDLKTGWKSSLVGTALACAVLLAGACGNSNDPIDSDETEDGAADAGTYVPLETVTLTGRVMAPSGEFPISGALVYLDRGTPEAIPSGVYDYECDSMDGKPHTLSNADGTWSLEVVVGDWNIVTRKGNFRRIRPLSVTVDMETAIPEETTTLPGAKSDDGLDTIPTFAVVRTNPDLTYNLLAKFGMAQLDGSGELIEGTEQFDIYDDDTSGSYPHTSTLFDDQSVLNSYQMIYLPCSSTDVGVTFANDKAAMLRSYVTAGGRIYNSCTVSLWTEAAFPDYIDYYQSDDPTKWDIGRRTGSGYETTGNVLDADMGAWLSVVTSEQPTSVPFQEGFVKIESTAEVDDGHGLEADNGVVKPKTWVEDNDAYPGSPLMVTYNYDAGKVFYSVYETSQGGTALTPQEFVLLYVILEVGVCDNLDDVVVE
jgi:hypothetical protein